MVGEKGQPHTHLRDEEQQDGLGEVANDADHGERHPGEVAEGVAHKHARGVPAYGHGGAVGARVSEFDATYWGLLCTWRAFYGLDGGASEWASVF